VYLTDWIKAGAISLSTTLTIIFQPYTSFDRPANIIQDLSLEQKAEIFELNIRAKHISQEGIFLYELPINLGDMCIWNGVHVGYRAIRYGVTQDPVDLQNLKIFVNSLKILQTYPNTDLTLLIRGSVLLEEWEVANPNKQQRKIFENETHIWREDASGDSFIGHVFGMAMAYKYGDAEIKEFIGQLAKDLYIKLQSDKFHLTNADGSRTKFHQIGPMIVSSPMSVAGLMVVAKIIELQYPNDPLAKEYHRLAIRCNQIHVVSHNFPILLWKTKYSNINKAQLSLYALYELEENPKYKKKYVKGFKRGWRALKDDGNTLLTFMVSNASSKTVKQKYLDKATQVLNEFSTDLKLAQPVDLREETSIRKVTWGELKASQPYPVWQRAATDFAWQRNPHSIKDFLGSSPPYTEFTGLDFLLAYYIGRLHGFI
jgi:hypothetical protein